MTTMNKMHKSNGNGSKPELNVGKTEFYPQEGWLNFNIHGLVSMRVAANAPTANLFLDIFKPFYTTEPQDQYDLTIQGSFEEFKNGAFGEAHGETDFYYNAEAVELEKPKVQIFFDGEGFRLNGAIELLVLALPLIDRLMINKGAAMIHALTVSYRGHGLCIPAWGGSGKTSTMAKLMKMDGFSFLGDDWAFLTRDENLLGYAKPMFIKPYHKSIYPHLFDNVHKPLVPIKLSKPISKLTTMMHPYVTKYPQIASITRKWSPEHMMVTPQHAFPEANFSLKAPVAAALFVERYQSETSEPVFEEKNTTWMVSKLIGNFHSELPKQSRLAMTTLGAAGLVPIEQSFAEKANILEDSLADKPSYLLRVPKHLTPDQASDIIVSHINKMIDFAKIG